MLHAIRFDFHFVFLVDCGSCWMTVCFRSSARYSVRYCIVVIFHALLACFYCFSQLYRCDSQLCSSVFFFVFIIWRWLQQRQLRLIPLLPILFSFLNPLSNQVHQLPFSQEKPFSENKSLMFPFHHYPLLPLLLHHLLFSSPFHSIVVLGQ